MTSIETKDMKNKLLTLAAVIAAILPFTVSASSQSSMATDKPAAHKGALVEMKTTMGDITLLLYDDTPVHQANFLKLVKDGYYDGVLFHRVIRDFMIQTGDPDSKTARPGQQLGAGDPGYTLEAEIKCPQFFHKRGALAAARTGDQVNPERRSSGSQFYIVTGRKFNATQLDQMEKQMEYERKREVFNRLQMENRDSIMSLRKARDNEALEALRLRLVDLTEKEVAGQDGAKFTTEQREAYTTVGGAPHLDGTYTIFGEVVDGMDVVDKIEHVSTDGADRPVEDVKVISMKVLGK